MKRKLFKGTLLLLVISILLTAFAGTALAETVYGSSGDSYIRSTPSLSGKSLGMLPQGASAAYLGETSVDNRGVAWYRISYGGITGWVSSMYTTLSGSGSYSYSSDYGTVYGSDGDSNIRSTPSLSGKDIGTLPQGASATYLGQTSVDNRGVAWYRISYGGVTGWVSSMYTTLSDSYSSSGAVYASDGDSYIRSTPSLYGTQVGMLPQGSSAAYLGQTSVDNRGVAWYMISYGGVTGWVSSMYTTLSGSYSYNSGSGTVYASDGDSYIRSTPSLYGTQVGMLPQGTTATYLGQTSVDNRGVAWYMISYGNVTGWVSSMYTTLY